MVSLDRWALRHSFWAGALTGLTLLALGLELNGGIKGYRFWAIAAALVIDAIGAFWLKASSGRERNPAAADSVGSRGVRGSYNRDSHDRGSHNVDSHNVVDVSNSHRNVTKTVINSSWGIVIVAVVAIMAVVASRSQTPQLWGPVASSAQPGPTSPVPQTKETASVSGVPLQQLREEQPLLLGSSKFLERAVASPHVEVSQSLLRVPSADFVNEGVAARGGRAVLIVDERRGADLQMTARVAAGIDAADSLFKPAFVDSGLFSKVYRGDVDGLRALRVDGMQVIALGIKSIKTEPENVGGETIVRATVSLVVRVIHPSSGFSTDTVSVQESGAGFDDDRAVSDGSEHAVKKLVAQLSISSGL